MGVFLVDRKMEHALKGRPQAAFDRKQRGMNSGIPFIEIADRVEATVNLKATRVSGPPVTLKR